MASYNYMVQNLLSREKCPSSETGKLHKWKPIGEIRGMPGNSYGVDFCCSQCNKRTTEFYFADNPMFKLIKREFDERK